MNTLLEGFAEAIRLIIQFDPKTYQALWLSLKVTLYALFISSVAGFPIGILLAFTHFKGKGIVLNLIYTFMGFPPVVAGLLVYLLYSRQGPLGALQLLFTPHVMVIAQIILALPVIIGLTYLGIKAVDPSITSLAQTLGATRWQTSWMVLKEMRLAILGALITAFGAAISEVGAAMLVGGNIEGYTRSLTTALMLETRQGNFARALALGIILITVAFLVNVAMVSITESKGIKRYVKSSS